MKSFRKLIILLFLLLTQISCITLTVPELSTSTSDDASVCDMEVKKVEKARAGTEGDEDKALVNAYNFCLNQARENTNEHIYDKYKTRKRGWTIADISLGILQTAIVGITASLTTARDGGLIELEEDVLQNISLWSGLPSVLYLAVSVPLRTSVIGDPNLALNDFIKRRELLVQTDNFYKEFINSNVGLKAADSDANSLKKNARTTLEIMVNELRTYSQPANYAGDFTSLEYIVKKIIPDHFNKIEATESPQQRNTGSTDTGSTDTGDAGS